MNKIKFKLYTILLFCFLLLLSSAALAGQPKNKKNKNKKVSANKSRTIASVGGAAVAAAPTTSSNTTVYTRPLIVSKSEKEQIEYGEVNTIFDKETPCYLNRNINPKLEFAEFEKGKGVGGSGSNAGSI
ncbi:MAG: hypothetical protein HQK49_02015 [Oligoflexia bacterium]|nr:hypothetical protein [Oligoflexia bacterium]